MANAQIVQVDKLIFDEYNWDMLQNQGGVKESASSRLRKDWI